MSEANEINYFSMMEILEYLYKQDLPGNNENSKNDYMSIMNTYLLEYAKKLKKKDFDVMLSEVSQFSMREFG